MVTRGCVDVCTGDARTRLVANDAPSRAAASCATLTGLSNSTEIERCQSLAANLRQVLLEPPP